MKWLRELLIRYGQNIFFAATLFFVTTLCVLGGIIVWEACLAVLRR